MTPRRSLAACLLLFGAALASCSPGSVAQVVRPAPPSAAQALEEPSQESACRSVNKYVEPLVVDWTSSARADLELAMKDGLAVVRYDCGKFELAKSCKAFGGYSFAPVSRKEDSVQLVGRDELSANLPLGAAKLSAGLERGSSIDIALVMIGKQRTNVNAVSRVELRGECEGVTHFIRSTFVGAFALGKGSSGVVRTAAELFGAGTSGTSESSRSSVTRDGDIAACRTSKTTDAAPPSQCESPLRVELVPIVAEAKLVSPASEAQGVPAAAPLENPCPEGMVRVGGKCGTAGAAPHQCAKDSAEECEQQCSAGDAASCYNLATLLSREPGGKRDDKRVRELYAKACEGGNAEGCLYAAYSMPRDAEVKARDALYAKACELGHAMACRVLGQALLSRAKDGDPAQGMASLGRGCHLADSFACGSLAGVYLFGSTGIAKDVKKGIGILNASCEKGNWRDCWNLGRYLTRCEASTGGLSMVDADACKSFEAPDPVAGAVALERACNNGGVAACHQAGWFLHKGKNGPKDLGRARMMYERACPKTSFNWDGCLALADMYDKGEGVAADPVKAREYLEQVCTLRMNLGGKACVRIASYYERGKGVAKDPAKVLEYYKKACVDCGLMSSCDAYGKMLEKAGDKDGAKAMYGDFCSRMKDDRLCAEYRRLGGVLPADYRTFPRRRED